ncbi:hypothetical protein [Clostridium saccharobutylicum]|uniref:Uncharacterized protein n=1 Tax=Clostridium saccharobutylicum DSM 13864 TaxID=1345695 RepID=U5MVR1_CLOSA|nr:hypothetical protein [Clostridium saccharobutylicum]AGX44628.1 hypothetical protein CLSA_c36670 [Clostridium saccharobutylicum DSM 13864]AQR91918.1 hypothetical protein CLOSC_36460 [Clostridium saccharobutylicum]AQS01820.1 hypothetical protein CSACC_36510 [Clostridium saccharobutylicum]AQS11417.1 hypothetical protein CLOBY_35730 [Clostridium saccharobutylicum]AQS15803.1 hypothetical protein CLOSACC_36510 [Clostridium saccharobutylicum]
MKSAYDEDKSFDIYLPEESKGLKAKRGDKGTIVYTNVNLAAEISGINGIKQNCFA